MSVFFLSHAARILYCNDFSPLKADYLVFEVLFGPGTLGIKMKSRKQSLAEGQEPIDIVYLENVPDEDITIVGPGKRVPLLRREPVILAVNGRDVTGHSLKQVTQVLSEAARPLTLRMQIGVTPRAPAHNFFASLQPSELSPVLELPGREDSQSPAERKSETPLSPAQQTETPLSPAQQTETPVVVMRRTLSARAVAGEGLAVHRYYREHSYRRSEVEEKQEDGEERAEEDVEEQKRTFVERIRTYFLLEMCELLEGFEEFICEGGEER